MSAVLWVIIFAAAGIFMVILYNRLVRDRNDVRNAWSAIEVQLKRRHDLIPNIVEAVKGYASHERATLDAVIQARRNAATVSGGVDAAAKK